MKFNTFLDDLKSYRENMFRDARTYLGFLAICVFAFLAVGTIKTSSQTIAYIEDDTNQESNQTETASSDNAETQQDNKSKYSYYADLMQVTVASIRLPDFDLEDEDKEEVEDIKPQVVYITDANLEAVIRDIIHKPNGDIYIEDLQYVTALSINGRGVQDISSIAYMTSLNSLDISNNYIVSLEPLRNLKKLSYLNITGNLVTDLSPIQSLSLSQLHCAYNQISSVSPLSGMTSLVALDISNNMISDVSPLAGLSRLSTLFIQGNNIFDESPLYALTSLTQTDFYMDNWNPEEPDWIPIEDTTEEPTPTQGPVVDPNAPTPPVDDSVEFSE